MRTLLLAVVTVPNIGEAVRVANMLPIACPVREGDVLRLPSMEGAQSLFYVGKVVLFDYATQPGVCIQKVTGSLVGEG